MRNVNSSTPDSSTLVLTWKPPDPTNGKIIYYIVRFTSHGKNTMEKNVTDTNSTAINLGKHYNYCRLLSFLFIDSGVPYKVSIIPVNLAGEGDILTKTYFTQELGNYIIMFDLMLIISPLQHIRSSQCSSYEHNSG